MPVPRRCCAIGFCLLALLLSSRPAHAIGDPDLEWWTIETAHFRVHYERSLEPVALEVARICEHLHHTLTGPLGYAPDSFVDVVITDDVDSANGSATAIPYNAVRLYTTAPEDLTPLSAYEDYYLHLLTHEFTHILHSDNISGTPAVVNAILGKTLAPNQIQPRWILEGVAIISETHYTAAGRLRASLWNMFLRADVLEDNIAGLDQFSNPARRWPQGTLWYLYGSYFLDWVQQIYGKDVMRAVSADYGASLIPWGLNRAIRRVTGKTYVELYEGFKQHLQRRYHAEMLEVVERGLREGKRLTHHGRTVHYPKLLPAPAKVGRGPYELVYYRDDYHHRAGIYRLMLGGELEGGRPPEQLLARAKGAGPPAVTFDGDLLYSSTVPYKNVYQRKDLFMLPAKQHAPGGHEPDRERLTVGLRATAPTVSPSGRKVAFTVNHRGTTALQIADLNSEGRLSGRRTLVPSARFEQVFTPAYSPDGRSIAFSRFSSGGYRDIWLVDPASGRTERITHDRAMDVHPCWSADGRKLYFSSDRTGIFNVYEYSRADGSLRQVTNVRTGAIMPTVSDDGQLLVYVGYTSAGYDLFAMRLSPERYLTAPPPPTYRPRAHADVPPTPYKRYRYEPLPTLRPYRYFFEYAPGSFGSNALTMSADGSDIVGHHGVSAQITADPAAPLPMFALQYTYGRLPFDLSIGLNNRVTPRNNYRFNDERLEYVEEAYGLRTGLSYPHLGEFISQRFGLSYTASVTDARLPVATVGRLDPYAEVTRDPFGGLISILHLGYSLSTTEGSFETAGSARGMSLYLGLDWGDEPIASEESVYSGTYRARAYVPMPWPGEHTLAISSSGGIAGGTYSRRGVFYVGGYNLEAQGVTDMLTPLVLDGGFTLRGYPPSSYSGSRYMLQNLEYRFPIAEVDRGLSTLPVYLRRIDGMLFLDYGGAFDELDFDAIELFSKGSLIYSPDFHTSAGFELWFGTTVGYGLDLHFRLGYGYGFSAEAEDGGQWYFAAASVF